MKRNLGQTLIWITTAGAIIVAMISGWFGFYGQNASAIDTEKNERKAEDTEIKINMATLKEAVDTTKGDVKEIKGDIKELLRRTPK